MAPKSAPPRPAPRLYLATSAITDPAPLLEALPGVLAGADIAALLVRLAQSDPRSMISRVKALAPVTQGANVAMLLDGCADLVARSGADGAHLTGITAMTEWMASLRPDRIVGVGGLATRHDSMLAGEAGADYVLFGEPDPQGQRPSRDAVIERVQWWAELFEPPCVAYAASPDEAIAFVRAGADFILADDLVWNDPAGAAAAASALNTAIKNAAHPVRLGAEAN